MKKDVTKEKAAYKTKTEIYANNFLSVKPFTTLNPTKGERESATSSII
jgi:hypothetical protein